MNLSIDLFVSHLLLKDLIIKNSENEILFFIIQTRFSSFFGIEYGFSFLRL